LTAELGAADLARLSRSGLMPLSVEAGLGFLDRAYAGAEAIAVAASLDIGALRRLSHAGDLPPLLSGLVGTSRRRAKAASGSLARRLAGVPEAEREALVSTLVREQVATILGHASADAIDPAANFKDLGFDSLGAVELRNRLGQVTGMRLKTTLVFDHPSSTEIGAYLLSQVGEGPDVQLPVYQELDRVEAALAKIEVDKAEKERLVARVRSFNNRLLQLWESGDGFEGAVATADLESVSDDELFELIDKELGSS
jgi:acyl carrier protein